MSTTESSLTQLLSQPTLLPPLLTSAPRGSITELLSGLEREQETNVFKAVSAGFVRGVTQPFSLIKPVGEISNRMKQYAGTENPTRISYGLGWLAGTLIPGALHFKVANALVRGVGGALVVADKAADLTRVGMLARGAVAGALYGAGQQADDLQDYFKQIAANAAIGGAADVVIPAAWSAISARWGSKAGKEVRDAVDATVDFRPVAGDVELAPGGAMSPLPLGPPKVSPVALTAHARAMQLMDQLDEATSVGSVADDVTEMEITAAKLPRTRGPGGRFVKAEPLTPAESLGGPSDVGDFSILQPTPERRLSIQLGLQQLNLPELMPGEVRIFPTPHRDAPELSKILNRVQELDHVTTTDATDPQTLVALKGTTDMVRIAKDVAQHGFARGQELLYKGEKWLAVRPTVKGDKIFITQPGRLQRPVAVPKTEVQFMPTIQDVVSQRPMRSVAPLIEKFVEKHTLWPDAGLRQAFLQFAKEENLGAGDRVNLLDRIIKWQRRALSDEDSYLGQTIETLDRELGRGSHPDGLFHELIAQKGLTYIQELVNGEWKYVLKNASARAISPPMTRQEAQEWVKKYAVEMGDVIDTPLQLADQTIPGSGVASTPPHTAIETSNAEFNPALNATSSVLPRAQFFKFAEDSLIGQGITDIKPFSLVFNDVSRAKLAYYKDLRFWLKGGKDSAGNHQEGLLDIFKKGSVRQSVKEDVVDMIELPRASWAAHAKQVGLNPQEVEVGKRMRDFLNRAFEKWIKDPEINITADDFIENYFPHYRRLSNEGADKSIVKMFDDKGLKLNVPARKFLSEMQRTGKMTKWDKDPFQVTLNYLRAGIYKSTMKKQMDAAVAHVRQIPETTPDLTNLKKSLINYLHLTSYGAPEAYGAVNLALNQIAKRLGINLDERSAERLINTLVGMNYSAYMGFRPGHVLRNLSQILITGYPTLGGKYMTYGLKTITANTKASFDELRRVGAISTEHVAVPGEDVFFDDLAAHSFDARGMVSKAASAVRKVGEYSLRWFNSADKINRGVVYFGQKRKAIDSWNLLQEGKISQEKFLSKSGLNFYGNTVKQEFDTKRAGMGIEAAAEYLGTIAAGDTQWIYQLGAGPALFSHGIGRLLGQYGTWPMWYVSYIAQGAKNLKGMDRALFLARNIAVNKAMVGAAAYGGYNLTRWTGLSSLGWMGGPVVDWASDFRDIVTGVQQSGEATAEREIALSRYGARDAGDVGVSMLPVQLGGRIQIKDPVRFATSFFSALTPGYLAMKDLYDALGAEGIKGAAAEIMNIPMETAGHGWPEVHVK